MTPITKASLIHPASTQQLPKHASTRKQVLIVEGNDTFRQFIGTFLSNDFEITSARTGLEAMTWLGRGLIPDMILANTQLTDITSAALLAALRNSGLFGSIPVIVIGEADNEEEREQFRKLGAADFFYKPFNPIRLHHRMIQILD